MVAVEIHDPHHSPVEVVNQRAVVEVARDPAQRGQLTMQVVDHIERVDDRLDGECAEALERAGGVIALCRRHANEIAREPLVDERRIIRRLGHVAQPGQRAMVTTAGQIGGVAQQRARPAWPRYQRVSSGGPAVFTK